MDWRGELEALTVRLGVEVLEMSPERVVGRMPVEGNTQAQGVLHGGASLALVEILGGAGANASAGAGRIALGVDINATHHRPGQGAYVTGIATPAHRGRSLATYDVVISDEQGRRVCTGRITCLLREV